MKKLLLSLLLIVSSAVFVFSEIASEGTCGDNVKWVLHTDSTLVVSGTGHIYDYTPGNSPLSSWSNYSKKVIIQDGVTYIGKNAFFNTGIREVIIASSVDSIGELAFQKCYNLTSVQFDENSLEHVCKDAFRETPWINNQTVDLFYIGKTLYSVGAKYDKESLTICNVREGTKYINPSAMYNCPNLTYVKLPTSLVSIGSGAFSMCFNIKGIDIAAVIPPVIGASTFDGIRWDINLSVPAGSEDAYRNATNWSLFYDRYVSGKFGDNINWEISADGVINITGSGDIPDVNWGKDIFPSWEKYSNCIKSIVIGEGITSIGKMAFDFYSTVSEVSFPSSLKVIKDFAFRGCNLAEINLPEGVTSIKYTAFGNNSNLKKVILPSTITEIGDYAFENCTNINPFIITAPNPPAMFDTSLPVNLIGVVKVPFNYQQAYKDNPVWKLYFFDYSTEISYSGKCGKDLDWVIDTASNSLTISGTGRMFDYLNSSGHQKTTAPWGTFYFDSLILNEGITYIGNNAFCQININSLNLPSSLKAIGDDSFYGCGGLHKVIIPDNVDSIGDHAFTLSSLDSLILGSNVSYIENMAFGNNKISYISMSSVTPPEVIGNPFNDINLNNLTFIVPEGSDMAYSEDDYWGIIYNKITNGTINDDIYWSFQDSVFTFFGNGDINFKYINLRPWNEFAHKVKHLVFNEGITGIGDNFTNYLDISVVDFPHSLRSIGVKAFEKQKNIKEIVLPDSLQKIDDYAFAYCAGISKPIVLSETITSIGNSAFAFCSNLSEVTLNAQTKTLHKGLFRNTNISEIVIPEGVTSIEDVVFDSCSNLKKIVLPSTLENIGSNCIAHNNTIDSIFSNAVIPPVLCHDSFNEINVNDVVVIVPQGSIDTYKVQQYWDQFKYQELTPTDVENVDGNADYDVYSQNGQLFVNCDNCDYTLYSLTGSVLRTGHGAATISNLPKGVYIISLNNRTFKVAL